MRGTKLLAAAIMGAAVALLAVLAFPGVGFGETTTTHGLTPSDVYTSTEPNVCNGDDKVRGEPVSLLPTAVHADEESVLVASFTSTWSAPSGSPTELLLTLQIGGGEFFDSSPEWIANTGLGGSERNAHGAGTVMWSFPDVAAGDYTVEATAHIAQFPGTSIQSGVNLQACALTVVVSPTA